MYNTTKGHHEKAHNNSTTNLPHRNARAQYLYDKMLGCGKFLFVGGDFVVQQVVELL